MVAVYSRSWKHKTLKKSGFLVYLFLPPLFLPTGGVVKQLPAKHGGSQEEGILSSSGLRDLGIAFIFLFIHPGYCWSLCSLSSLPCSLLVLLIPKSQRMSAKCFTRHRLSYLHSHSTRWGLSLSPFYRQGRLREVATAWLLIPQLVRGRARILAVANPA